MICTKGPLIQLANCAKTRDMQTIHEKDALDLKAKYVYDAHTF